jgi:hypothetical protein
MSEHRSMLASRARLYLSAVTVLLRPRADGPGRSAKRTVVLGRSTSRAEGLGA